MTSAQGYCRPTTARELEQLAAASEESFALPAGAAKSWFEYAGSENLRAWRDGEDVVGGLVLVPMAQFWGGRRVPLCGFAGVSVLPHMRGTGVATRMMAASLRELRDEGWPLAGLYPATQPVYRRVGFEQCGLQVETRGPITALPLSERSSLPMRPFRADDLPAVKALYTEVARHRPGWLDRGPYVWHRVQNPRGQTAHGYVVGTPGEVVGYVFLSRLPKPSMNIDVRVLDMNARDAAGWRRLLAVLRDHDSLAEDVIWTGGFDDVRLQLLEEQRLTSRVLHAWMLRILDVRAALEARGYPRGLRQTLHLEVTDALLPENAGRFVLEVDGGEARVQAGGEGALRCDIRSLATIFSGFRSARALSEVGAVEAAPEALEAAGEIFAGAPPSTPDMY